MVVPEPQAAVGQGDAILVTTPSGQHILVGGGPDPLEAARLVGSALPFWDRRIDVVVRTHPHADHVARLTELLRRYDMPNILEHEIELDTAVYRE